MDRIFLTVLNMSLTASFVIAAVLLARLLLRRAPKIISYALWAVVLFNLLCPFKPESAFSLIPFNAKPISEQQAILPGQEFNFAEAALYSLQTPGDDMYVQINPAIIDADPDSFVGTPYEHLSRDDDGKAMAYLFGYQAYLILGNYLWPFGAAILILYAIIGYIRLKRRVSLAVRVEGIIYETDRIDSPFVLGLLRPRVYIPTGMVTALTAHIIEHERTHIKRRDYIVSFIAFAALALHWFNPLVWVAYTLMLRDMESSCDEAVLRNSNEDIRREYSSALLGFSSNRKQLSFPLAFGEQGVKERVKNVLKFKKSSRVIIVVAVALVAVLSVGFAVNRANGVEIELPNADDVSFVSMNQYNEFAPIGEAVIRDRSEIDTILSVLSGAAKTRKQSIHDAPIDDNYLVVRLHLANEIKTFCLYTDGTDYIEEPYLGIYRSRQGFRSLYSIYTAHGDDELDNWAVDGLRFYLPDTGLAAHTFAKEIYGNYLLQLPDADNHAITAYDMIDFSLHAFSDDSVSAEFTFAVKPVQEIYYIGLYTNRGTDEYDGWLILTRSFTLELDEENYWNCVRLEDVYFDKLGQQETAPPSGISINAFPNPYTTVMSSSPGMRIDVSYNAPFTDVHYYADFGSFLTLSEGIVTALGSDITVAHDMPVYWTPFAFTADWESADDNTIGDTVSVTVIRETDKLAMMVLPIAYDGDGWYSIGEGGE
ncbi:MAG: DUF5301 domain-containing protein [Oscillospiraceae bacterium]|jgi:beta-lactamase regulating signal transducer with metallopeptidase domain|nr:DUF5301 domain-containing protein [Oscillospiraceae bacterium]